jgi:hypothetical protein
MKNALLLLLMLIASFSTAQTTATTHPKTSKKNVKKPIKKTVLPDTITVSFFSFGSGIDAKAYKNLLQSIANYDSTNGIKTIYRIEKKGKEGEKKVIIHPQNTKPFTAFVEDLRVRFKDNKRVEMK